MSETVRYIVPAPIRYAIVGPGAAFPEVALSSSDSVSDLVGVYSLRDLGLSTILSPQSSKRTSFFDLLVAPRKRTEKNDDGHSILEVEINPPPHEHADRNILVSLISEGDLLNHFVRGERESISKIVEKIYRASQMDDRQQLEYYGSALSTVLSELKNRSLHKKRRAFEFRLLIITYSAAATLILVIFSMVALLMRQTGI